MGDLVGYKLRIRIVVGRIISESVKVQSVVCIEDVSKSYFQHQHSVCDCQGTRVVYLLQSHLPSES